MQDVLSLSGQEHVNLRANHLAKFDPLWPSCQLGQGVELTLTISANFCSSESLIEIDGPVFTSHVDLT